jgi:RNA polymerase sigma factor (sigma-70 family)
MVRGVCRRVLREEEDVEDVWQATFLTLARKASGVGSMQSLGGWLYQVAYRMALRVRANATRRERHERAAGGPTFTRETDDPLQQAVQRDLCEIVSEEIDRLPEKYRTPVVLCYLEGKTNEEAALLLGCPAGTIVTWLARTREQLRVRLARRGVVVGASALIALLTRPDSGEAASSAVRAATVQAALAFADGHLTGAVVSHRVVSLTTGACHAMSLNRLKIIPAVLATLCLVGVGSGVLASRLPDPTVRVGIQQPIPENPQAADEGQDDSAPADEQKPKPADPQAGREKNDQPKAKVGRHKAEEVINQSFKTGKSPTVVLEVMNGRIEVVADSADTVTARMTKRTEAASEDEAKQALKDIDLKLTQDKDKPDAVRITAKYPDENRQGHQVGVDAEIRVPAGAVLELRTSNGAVNLTGGTGGVVVNTSNGAIVAKDGKGRLQLNTSNGAITVTGATGKIDLKTSNGPIELKAEKAAVSARTSNGGVTFAGTLADGPHMLTTTNGPVRLTLPADARFKIAAMTSYGQVANEFGVELSGTAGRTLLNATVGKDPKVEIGVQTSNAGVEIRKKKD